MILVTGATGNNGREVVKALAARGVAAKAMVRAAKDATALPTGITKVEGDFDNKASLADALAGVERAFLLTPSTERAQAQQLRFVEAAERAGVRHIVKLSQFAAAEDSPVRFLRYHAAVEAAIRSSGLAWTFLRPNLFMQGLLQFAGMIRETGALSAPIGAARVSVVDVRDNAAVAAVALTEGGHEGITYTLTGPEALTHADMAAHLSEAAGQDIRFKPINDDEMRQALAGAGMPPWQVEGLIEDYAHYQREEAAQVTTGVRDATGRAPHGFGAFAADVAELFKAAPAH